MYPGRQSGDVKMLKIDNSCEAIVTRDFGAGGDSAR